jgi:hypothetical protein
MKLTAEKAASIRKLLETETQATAAKRYKVSRSTVSDIATNRIWADAQADDISDCEAELVHVKRENLQLRRIVTSSKLNKGLFNALVSEMETRVKPFAPAKLVTPKARRGAIIEDAVLHLSDGHHDQIITREESGGFEQHNFAVACRRAETYVDTAIDWTQRTLAPQFHFPRLTVLAYGDHTSGEIHGAATRSAYRNQFKNCLAIGQLHASMFRDLAAHFPNVQVLYLSGNHGRRSVKKDFHGAHDNWDYMVAQIARLHCRDLRNVSFNIPNAWSANVDIGGVGFHVFHGDDIQTSMGVPWYGLARRQKGLQALRQPGTRIRYFVCGHFHKPGSMGDADGELLVNGPWVATDAYAFNRFSSYTEPTQLFHGVNQKYGVTWRLPIRLRTSDESKGPTRYKIPLSEDFEG